MEEGGSSSSSLPTRQTDEFKPFVRRLPEFKFWYSATRAIVLAFCCSWSDIFNLPVFWPVLVVYWLILLFLTLRRQIQHMLSEFSFRAVNPTMQEGGMFVMQREKKKKKNKRLMWCFDRVQICPVGLWQEVVCGQEQQLDLDRSCSLACLHPRIDTKEVQVLKRCHCCRLYDYEERTRDNVIAAWLLQRGAQD